MLYFHVFFFLTSNIKAANRPVVIFPPMFGSVLFGSVKNVPVSHWFCLKTFNDSWIWQNDQYLIPPITDCMADYLRCGWNWTTKKPDSRNESYIYTYDFGGDKGIRYLDEGVFGVHFVHAMDGLLTKLEGHNYTVRKDVFGAPFDWRLNPLNSDQFNIDSKKLIEEAYEMNGGQKVSLFGYSGGCFAMQYFLARTVSQEWKDKYVDHIVLVGPSYGGAMSAILCLWSGISWFAGGDSKPMSDFLLSVPTLYAHIPNYKVHRDKLYPFIGPDGKKYTLEEAKEILYKYNRVDDIENRLVYEYAEKDVLIHELYDPGVDAYILMNTNLPTVETLNFSNGWDQEPDVVMGEGDMCLSKESLLYACNNWKATARKNNKTVVCHDYRMNNQSWGHGSMLGIPEIMEEVYQGLTNDDWRIGGNYLIEGRRKRGEEWKNMMKL